MNASDLIFNNENGISSGGFSVKSIMMKNGLSPIMTLNNDNMQIGGMNNVSDIFNNLVVPNWAFTNYNDLIGGGNNHVNENKEDDDVLDDDIHDRLVNLVRHYDKSCNKKQTKKNSKLKSKNIKTKKNKSK